MECSVGGGVGGGGLSGSKVIIGSQHWAVCVASWLHGLPPPAAAAAAASCTMYYTSSSSHPSSSHPSAHRPVLLLLLLLCCPTPPLHLVLILSSSPTLTRSLLHTKAPLRVMFGHRYAVPLVFSDCAPAESLSSALDALQQLDSALLDLFGRLQQRMTEQRAMVGALTSRIAAASSKVQQLSGQPNRVTTLFSAAKYPAPPSLPSFHSVNGLQQVSGALSGGHVDVRVVREDWTEDERPHCSPQARPPPHAIPRHDRFVCAAATDTSALFAHLSKARLTRTEHVTDEAAEGLGRLPSYLPSISSILLFNSDENPYKAYHSINNLEGTAGEDRKVEQAGPSAAPRSIVEGADLPTFSAYQFEYRPLLGELPTFDLPANLPLGMLADISFGSSQAQLSIAPSSAHASNIALPSLSQLTLSTLPQYPTQPSALPTAAAPAGSAPAPPPPPPPPPPSAPFGAPSAPPLSSVGAPPAPPLAPPPPPPPAPSAPDAPPAPPKAASPSSSSGGDGRNSLLDAIRNRSQVKLRKVVQADGGGGGGGGGDGGGAGAAGEAGGGAAGKAGGGGGGKRKADSGGGDMMSALKAQLERRKAALMGNQQPAGGGGGGGGDAAARPSGPSSLLPPSLLPKLDRKTAASSPEMEDGEEGAAGAGGAGAQLNHSLMTSYLAAHSKKQTADEEEWS